MTTRLPSEMPGGSCEKAHGYSPFGKWQENCVKCGKQNPLVTLWLQLVTTAVDLGLKKQQIPQHPYLSLLVGGGTTALGEDRPPTLAWTHKQMKAYYRSRRG